MTRRRNIVPSIQLNVALPEDIHDRMTLHLYSELEGRVPFGSYQRFLVERIKEYFSRSELDLAPWIGVSEGVYVVTGPKPTVEVLTKALDETM